MLETNIAYIVIISILGLIAVNGLFKKKGSLGGSIRNPERDVLYVDFGNGVSHLENKYYVQEMEIKGSQPLSGYLTFCGYENKN